MSDKNNLKQKTTSNGVKEKIKEIYHYSIKLKDQKIVSLEKEDEKGKMISINNFESPVTKNKLLKIYIVKHEANIVYVGFTSQSIRSRLRGGLQAQGMGGYHGYQFKKLNKIDLFVICFDEAHIREKVEGIEAEIVYLIRNKTGNWPKYQTEIHFHKVAEEEKKIADLIYKKTKKSVIHNP